MRLSDGRGIKTPLWFTNEMLRQDDINQIGKYTYQNTVDLLGTLVKGASLVGDVVIGGIGVTWSAGLTLSVGSGMAVSQSGTYLEGDVWGFVPSTEKLFVVSLPEDVLVACVTGGAYSRRDTIQIRPNAISYGSKTRNFKDPVTGLVSSTPVNTSIEYGYEFMVLKGNDESDGNPAPATTAGWIKVAEVEIGAGVSVISDANIYGVERSPLWSTSPDSTRLYHLSTDVITLVEDTYIYSKGLYRVDGFYNITLPASLTVNDTIEIIAGPLGCMIKQGDAENIVLSKNSLTTVKGLNGSIKLLPNQTCKFVYLGAGTYLSETVTQLTSIATTVNYQPTDICWSPDGIYLAVCFEGVASPNVKWYKRSGDTLSVLTFPATGMTYAKSLDWSPDGIYLAVCFNTGNPDVKLYKRSGDTMTLLSFPATVGMSYANALKWSPDGNYLAIVFGGSGTSNIQWYKRNGDTMTLLSFPATIDNSPSCLDWSPDGNYLAVGNITNVTLYKRTGDTMVSLTIPNAGETYSINWSPDGNYLLTTNVLFKRNGDTMTFLPIISFGGADNRKVKWSPDGNYIAITSNVAIPSSTRIFRKIGDNFVSVSFPDTGVVSSGPIDWSPDGKYLVVGISGVSPNILYYKFYFSAGKEYLVQVDSDDKLPLMAGLSVRPS